MPVHHLPEASGGWAAAAECLGRVLMAKQHHRSAAGGSLCPGKRMQEESHPGLGEGRMENSKTECVKTKCCRWGAELKWCMLLSWEKMRREETAGLKKQQYEIHSPARKAQQCGQWWSPIEMGRKKKDTRYINTCWLNKARNRTAKLSKQGWLVMGDSLSYLPCWNTGEWQTRQGKRIVLVGITQLRRVRSWWEQRQSPWKPSPKEEQSNRQTDSTWWMWMHVEHCAVGLGYREEGIKFNIYF